MDTLCLIRSYVYQIIVKPHPSFHLLVTGFKLRLQLRLLLVWWCYLLCSTLTSSVQGILLQLLLSVLLFYSESLCPCVCRLVAMATCNTWSICSSMEQTWAPRMPQETPLYTSVPYTTRWAGARARVCFCHQHRCVCMLCDRTHHYLLLF